jgi:DUF971 family protein
MGELNAGLNEMDRAGRYLTLMGARDGDEIGLIGWEYASKQCFEGGMLRKRMTD